MSSYLTFRANAHRIEITGNWSVTCLRCGDFIGVMTSETLREAIIITSRKGGVICPSCRTLSCEFCGLGLCPADKEKGHTACVFCELDGGGKEKRSGSIYLVPQKSKTPALRFVLSEDGYRMETAPKQGEKNGNGNA